MKTRKLISCVLALILIFSALPAINFTTVSAKSVRIGDWKIQKRSYDDNYTLMGYYGSSKSVSIPKKLNGKLITAIEKDVIKQKDITSLHVPNTITWIVSGAFRNCKKLTKVTFEKGSKLLEIYAAFTNCTSLKSVTLPDSVESISYSSFKGCSSLTTVKAKGVTYIGRYAFEGCKNLKNFDFSKIRQISRQGFTGCTKLTNVELPSVISIHRFAFSKCTSLKTITLSEKLWALMSGAFKDCSALKEIIVPEKNKKFAVYDGAVCRKNKSQINAYPPARKDDNFELSSKTVKIKEYAFYGAKDLKADLNFSKKIKYIGDYAFAGCEKIENISMPDTVTHLGKSVFKNTAFMKAQKGSGAYYIGNILIKLSGKQDEYKIKEGTTLISNYAISDCKIGRLTIPESVTKFLEFSLSGTGSVDTLIVDFDISAHKKIGFKNYSCTIKGIKSDIKNVVINYPITTLGSQFSSTDIKSIELPETVTSLQGSAFSWCDDLEYAKLSEQITEIPRSTFYRCKSLKQIDLPQNLKKIGGYAFFRSGIEQIEIPETVSRIYTFAFSNCKKLKYVKLPDKVKNISDSMFRGCTRLEKVDFANDITRIGKVAFAFTKIESIEIPDTVTELGTHIFARCDSLENVKLPKNDSIKAIPKCMFKNASIKEIVIPEGYEVIYDEAFYKSDVENITLPSTLTQIHSLAFAQCKLKNITIPSGVKNIGFHMLSSCQDLEEVTFKGNIESISGTALDNCQNLKTVVFEQGVQSISDAFNNCTSLSAIYIKKGTVSDINENAFKGAKSGIKFYVNTKKQAKTLKGALEKTNIKSAKIYANNVLVYKNVG